VKVVTQSRRNMVELPLSDNQPCSGVQNGLERTQMYRSDAKENAIAVVHTCTVGIRAWTSILAFSSDSARQIVHSWRR